ncbi:MAG: hypothetical protein JWR90_1384 [Marmoricola sp.]|jgi:hypothetical protein|nr:hypothetical protein [Marmoricola sp.]
MPLRPGTTTQPAKPNTTSDYSHPMGHLLPRPAQVTKHHLPPSHRKVHEMRPETTDHISPVGASAPPSTVTTSAAATKKAQS